uniref:Uncharacterized protein n=1 Tax=viral metagenome TaxID=1070528 RepID=A0A6H2A3H6_9ZZZZ
MSDNHLIIVAHDEDIVNTRDLLLRLIQDESVTHSQVHPNGSTYLRLKNGVRFYIISVDHIQEDHLRGMDFDHVHYLTHIPDFVRKILGPHIRVKSKPGWRFGTHVQNNSMTGAPETVHTFGPPDEEKA